MIAIRSVGKLVTAHLARSALALACATLVTMFAACTIEPCPEFDSPRPEAFEVHDWCGDDRCELNGEPAQCHSGGCLLRRDEVLSFPLADFVESAKGRDVAVTATNGG